MEGAGAAAGACAAAGVAAAADADAGTGCALAGAGGGAQDLHSTLSLPTRRAYAADRRVAQVVARLGRHPNGAARNEVEKQSWSQDALRQVVEASSSPADVPGARR